MMPSRCDVLVVGAGIIGATTALALAREGLTVVCAGQPASRLGTASGAAGAMLGVLGEVTAEDDNAPGSLDEASLRLRHAAATAWPALADTIAEATGREIPIHRGTAVIATADRPADRGHLTAIRATAHRLGLPCEAIVPADIPYLSPAPGHETIDALWLPDEGHVDTGVLLPAVHQALTTHPRIQRTPALVRRVLHDTGRVTGADLDDDTTVHAAHVVLAAGVGTQALLDGIAPHTGVPARLLPGKGTSVILRDDDAGAALEHLVIRTPNREFACGTHLIGRPGGTLYLGATNRIGGTPGADPAPNSGELIALLDSGTHDINPRLRTAPVTLIQHGMRPLSTDGHPLIGPTALDGLHLATGTYRNGILLAPALASAVTATITGKPAPDSPFSPTAAWRHRTPDITTLLATGVPHLVEFIVQPHGRLPYNRKGELQTALWNLLRLAFTDTHDPELTALRERCRTLLSAHVPECVAQVFYELTGTTS